MRKNRFHNTLLVSLILILGFAGCKKTHTTGPLPFPVIDLDIPLISIETNGEEIVDEPKIQANMLVLANNETVFEGNIGIELRGSTSRRLFDKKSFAIETWDADGNDIDVNINGLPEEEDWVLYGPYSDKTLIRNMLIYDLARDIGGYASRGFFTEIEVNGEYEGVYVFLEKIKRDDNRLALSNLRQSENSGEDLTGGYILKIDKTAGDSDDEDWSGDVEYTQEISFRSEYGVFGDELSYSAFGAKRGEETYYLYEDPSASDITSEQKNYIQSYINEFETAIINDEFESVYQNYIDIDSFVDHFILNELSGNPDAYRLSTYLHKDKNEKLRMGPIWDFNIALGNDGRSTTEGWIIDYNQNYPDDLWLIPFYWEKLFSDPVFQSTLRSRWNNLRSSSLSVATIHAKIDSYANELGNAGAIDRNFDRWDILGEQVAFNSFVGETYEDEINYVKDWVEARIEWMDDAINN
jgi:hypothetical protein